MKINCQILNTDGTSRKGLMFSAEENYTEEDLILWVKRNCKGCNKIEINSKNIIAFFEDRIESYTLEK